MSKHVTEKLIGLKQFCSRVPKGDKLSDVGDHTLQNEHDHVDYNQVSDNRSESEHSFLYSLSKVSFYFIQPKDKESGGAIGREVWTGATE